MLPLTDNALDEMVIRERERGAPPLTDWDSLSARLRAEGLIREPVTTRFAAAGWMKVAAAMTLAIGGAAVGRVSAGASLLPVASVESTAQSSAEQGPVAEGASNATLASAAAVTQFASPDEAWEVLNRAGEEYRLASAYLSETNNEVPMPAPTDQYRTRLAALDNVMDEMRDAIKAAPQDPVINQFYLATVGAREATLTQLGTVLPARTQLNRF